MQLKKITDCCHHLNIIEKRCMNADFVELVFQNEDLAEWQRILSSFLGPPIKPADQEPTPNDLKVTAGTGSIRYNQTLFEKAFENVTIIAKFWPWDNQHYTTLRMALLIN